jgi:hypothetical protein
VLQVTHAGAVKVSADARRQLKALLVTAPEPLRAALLNRTWLWQASSGRVVRHQLNRGGDRHLNQLDFTATEIGRPECDHLLQALRRRHAVPLVADATSA